VSHPRLRGSVRLGAASVGAMLAALLSSLCCLGPLLFVTLGVGAGLASRFEPLRPLFAVASLGLLGAAFYATYGTARPVAHATDAARSGAAAVACDASGRRTRNKVMVWVAAVIVILLLTFPQWSLLLA